MLLHAIFYRVFGVGAFACGLVYAAFHCCYGRKIDERMMVSHLKSRRIISITDRVPKSGNQWTS